MQERFNTRLLVLLLLIALLLSGGWYFLHKYQMRGHAAGLMEMASAAEAQGRLDRAARFVGLYLDFAGADSEARIRFGKLLEKQAKTPKALSQVLHVYDQALLEQPDNHALRRHVIDLGLKLRYFDDTLRHVNKLQQAFPDDGDLDFKRARCLEGRGQDKEAAEAYQAALKHAPDKVEAYQNLAILLRNRLDQSIQADQIMEDLVAANARSAQARLARALYRQTYGVKGAEADLQEARKLAPDDIEVLLASTKVAIEQGHLDEARRFLQHAADKLPKDPPQDHARLYLSWAAVETAAGQLPEAVTWLRRGIKEFPGESPFYFNLANLLIETRALAEAQAVVGEMDRLKLAPAQADFLRARQYMAEGKWAQATELLEATRPLLAEQLDLTIRCNLLLAECYGEIGDAERQVAALRQATSADPRNARAHADLATVLARLGRYDEALEHGKRLLKLPRIPADTEINIARLELARALRQPPEERRWDAVDDALTHAAKEAPDSVQVPLLRAEVLRAQGENAEAQKLLEATRDRFSKSLEPWLALAALADRDGKTTEVQRLLDGAAKALGAGQNGASKAAVDLTLARLYFVRSEKDLPVVAAAEQKAAALKSGTDDQIRLLRGVAAAYLRLGKKKEPEARRVWQRVAGLQPQDFPLRLLLFDLARRADDSHGMDQAIGDIKRLEGSAGPMGQYARACYDVWQARHSQKEQPDTARQKELDEARTLLTEVAARRPAWAQVPLVQGEIDDLEGKPDKALEHYRHAIELGDRQPSVIRRVAEHLFARQRFAEADQVIRKLLDESQVSPELQKLGAEVSLRALDKERALKLAQQAVPAASKDFRDHIWKGRLLWALGRQQEAESSLRRAVELKDDVPDPWIALVQYFAATGQRQKGEDLLREAQKKLTGNGALLALGQGYGMLGQAGQADEQFQKALAAEPQNGNFLRQAANYFIQVGQRKKAIPLLRQLIHLPRQAADDDLFWGRRTLALALTVDSAAADFKEALGLIKQNEEATPGGHKDLYVEARLFASRPDYLKQAIQVFEELAKQQTLSPDQQFLLAQLYETQANEPRARDLMLEALTADSQNPVYLVHYARRLLERDDIAEAKNWIDRLKLRHPGSVEALALQARALAMTQRWDKALGLISEFAAKPQESAERYRYAAQLLDRLSQDIPGSRATFVPAAEKDYRRWLAEIRSATPATNSAKKDAVTPGNGPYPELLLADFLGRQGRPDEALKLCEQVLPTGPPQLVCAFGLAVVAGLPADDPRMNKVEQWINAAMANKRDAPAALTALLAVLREFQGRFADAEHLYRQAMQYEPRNERALNNLAYLLALQGKNDEAFQFIQQRMQLTGPFGAALDTRSMVYLGLRQYDKAIEDLQICLATEATPTRYYHLALAYDLSGRQDEAKRELKKAKDRGLNVRQLHRLEQARCEELLAKLSK